MAQIEQDKKCISRGEALNQTRFFFCLIIFRNLGNVEIEVCMTYQYDTVVSIAKIPYISLFINNLHLCDKLQLSSSNSYLLFFF